jgi:hypothetical protein
MIGQFTRCVAQYIDSALQKTLAPVALQANYTPWQAPSLPGISTSIGGYNQPLSPTSGLSHISESLHPSVQSLQHPPARHQLPISTRAYPHDANCDRRRGD